jgi:hypothetical protein
MIPVMPLVAAILNLFFQCGCSDFEVKQEIYRSTDWQTIMQGHSDLDKDLANYWANDTSPNWTNTHFQTLLLTNNVSPNVINHFTEVLLSAEKLLDRPAYHGPVHTARVGNVAASVLSTTGKDLSKTQKILFTIAALLHDIDPHRPLGTAPRVSATFLWMDTDKNIVDLLQDLHRENGITKNQIKAVIKYTDFDIDPIKLAAIKTEANRMADDYFDAVNAAIVKVWGPRIAFIDQVAMYIGSYDFAFESVIGLGNEFRTAKENALRSEKNINEKVNSPTDVDLLRNTAAFLKQRLNDPNFSILPPAMQSNFIQIQEKFDARWTNKTYLY